MFNGKQYATRLWRELIDAFGGREDVKVVLAIGSREEALEVLGPLPSNFEAMKFVDQAPKGPFGRHYATAWWLRR